MYEECTHEKILKNVVFHKKGNMDTYVRVRKTGITGTSEQTPFLVYIVRRVRGTQQNKTRSTCTIAIKH
jgi:hypothetical protein